MSTESLAEPESLILDAIEAAEAIPDPLAGIVEQTATNPGAPFMPIALGRWRAACAGRRPSCARSASTSASSAEVGRGHG